MTLETVKMSSKGQIVIPQGIREEVHAAEGTIFAVIGNHDTIILKKIATPSKEELIQDLGRFAQKAKAKLQKRGVTEKDLRAKVRKSGVGLFRELAPFGKEGELEGQLRE